MRHNSTRASLCLAEWQLECDADGERYALYLTVRSVTPDSSAVDVTAQASWRVDGEPVCMATYDGMMVRETR